MSAAARCEKPRRRQKTYICSRLIIRREEKNLGSNSAGLGGKVVFQRSRW
jgi:hypothetical protein